MKTADVVSAHLHTADDQIRIRYIVNGNAKETYLSPRTLVDKLFITW